MGERVGRCKCLLAVPQYISLSMAYKTHRLLANYFVECQPKCPKRAPAGKRTRPINRVNGPCKIAVVAVIPLSSERFGAPERL